MANLSRNYSKIFLWSVFYLCCIGMLWFGASSTGAAAEPEEKASTPWSAKTIRQLADEAALALETSRKAVTPDRAAQLGVGINTLEERVRQWVELGTLYDEVLSEIEKRAQLEKESAALQEELNAFEQRGLLKQPPYALSYYDDLLLEYDSLQQQLEINASTLKSSQQRYEESEKRFRSGQARLESQPLPAQNGNRAIGWRRDGQQLEIRLADAERRLYRLEIENLKQTGKILASHASLVNRQAKRVRMGLEFDQANLDAQLQILEQKKKDIQAGLKQLTQKKQAVDQQRLQTQRLYQNAVNASDLARLRDKLKIYDQWRKTYEQAIDQHEEMIRLVDQQQQTWRRRYELLNKKPDSDTRSQWLDQSRQNLDRIRQTLPIEQQRQNSLWQQTVALEETVRAAGNRGDAAKDSEALGAMRRMAIHRLDYIGMLVTSRRLDESLIDEINDTLDDKPLIHRLEWFSKQLGRIWNYQIWVIDDRPVTVQKILFALVILLAGFATVKIIIRRISTRFFSRPQIKATTAATIQKLLLYTGYFLVVLLALRIVNIPLAAFAFLGGAIAIGVGFGAQNLINNFISGFIIMGEQPINIGDLIEVDGVLGEVEEVGARSTRIRTGENIHILVPNSSFLEKNITNWTHSDRMIRAHVDVGVAYGSPVEQVEQLLLRACSEYEAVNETPEPFVLFTDFGDNALMFKVHFWIHVERVIERRMIESRLRFRIDELFHQAGIVIAFPQRDVHLTSEAPLRIQLQDNAGASGKTPRE